MNRVGYKNDRGDLYVPPKGCNQADDAGSSRVEDMLAMMLKKQKVKSTNSNIKEIYPT